MLDQCLDEAGVCSILIFFFFNRGTVSFHSRLGECTANGGKQRIRHDLIQLHHINFMYKLRAYLATKHKFSIKSKALIGTFQHGRVWSEFESVCLTLMPG